MRLGWFSVWLFALALMFQAAAPTAARVAIAQGGGAGQWASVLCLNADSSSETDKQKTPGKHDQRRDSCSLCQIGCDASAALAFHPGEIGKAHVHRTQMSWTVADRVLPAQRRDFARQARAPPAIS
jgi:hypothetical protein